MFAFFSTIFFKKLNARSQSCWNLNTAKKASSSKTKGFHLLRSYSLENLHDFVVKKLRSAGSSVTSIPEELNEKEAKARDYGLKWKARARKISLRR